MKVTKRDIGLLILLVGVLAAILSYNFLYQKNVGKAEAEKAVLQGLKDTQAGLKELEDNLPFYEAEIERMGCYAAEFNTIAIDDGIVAHYPADILPENEIMYAVDMEDNNEIYFGNLGYGSPSMIVTGVEEQTGVAGYGIVMSLNYQGSYDGLKEVILYNNAQDKRMVFDSLTAAYDSTTGMLTGNMTLSQYYMTGTENIYAEPYVPAMDLGTDNIFGTMEMPENAEEAAPAEEAPAEEAAGE